MLLVSHRFASLFFVLFATNRLQVQLHLWGLVHTATSLDTHSLERNKLKLSQVRAYSGSKVDRLELLRLHFPWLDSDFGDSSTDMALRKKTKTRHLVLRCSSKWPITTQCTEIWVHPFKDFMLIIWTPVFEFISITDVSNPLICTVTRTKLSTANSSSQFSRTPQAFTRYQCKAYD